VSNYIIAVSCNISTDDNDDDVSDDDDDDDNDSALTEAGALPQSQSSSCSTIPLPQSGVLS